MNKKGHLLNRDEYIKYLVYPKAFQVCFWLEEILGAGIVAFCDNSIVRIIGITLLGSGVLLFLVELILTILFSLKN